jgi:hypothetical protein
VNLVGRAQVLAQQPERNLGNGERIGRVDTEVRGERGVRFAAGVFDVHVRNRRNARIHVFVRRGVHHHRRVHAVERAPLEQVHLATAAFLGRRTDQVQGDAQLVGEWRQRQRGTDGSCGDDVVTTRVADAGQRVVLGADREMERAVADRRLERGRQLADAHVDRKPGI